jgi:hypothetical protein
VDFIFTRLITLVLVIGGTMVAANYGYQGGVGIATAILVGAAGSYLLLNGLFD